MDIDREALIQIFIDESNEALASMEEAVLHLESQPDDLEAVNTLFRHAHTFKGNAAVFGFTATSEFAHALEDLLEQIRQGKRRVTPAIADLLLQSIDGLKDLVPAQIDGRTEMTAAQKDIVDRLRGKASPAVPTTIANGAELGATSTATSTGRGLRVGLDKLDKMINLVGQLVVARGRMSQILIENDAGTALTDAFLETERISTELQDAVLETRMVPLGPIFRKFARTIRDLAAAGGKQARLTIDHADVEVDTSVAEKVRDPLTHMIRNAIDHGIELPDVRRARGKDPVGTIALRARYEGSMVVIELSDDGAGLQRERILARARERGLIAEGQELSDREILHLIFQAGFSTSQTVTELSGRGVGMDVVRRNITALRGAVDVSSREGEGATVTIRLPLTLALIQGFLVSAGGERYVVPLENVVECIEMPDGASTSAKSGIVDLRGEPVAYLRLHRALGGPTSTSKEHLVVVEHANEVAALALDQLLGETQVVVKPLGYPLQSVRGISGSTILGDGRIALILDVPALLREARTEVSA